jgi:hypothetical protein
MMEGKLIIQGNNWANLFPGRNKYRNLALQIGRVLKIETIQ